EKAELSDHVKRSLRADKALLKTLSREKLAAFGQAAGIVTGEIRTEAAGEQAAIASQLEELYDISSVQAGNPVALALNDAAERLAGGENAAEVKQELLETVRAHLQASEFVTAPPDTEGVGEAPEGAGRAPDAGEEGRLAPEAPPPELILESEPETADAEVGLEVQDDIFGAPAPAEGGDQFGLFGEDDPTGAPRRMQGFTEAQEQAVRTVDVLRERVAKGLATEAELAQYQEARALLARDTDEVVPRERPTPAPEFREEPEDMFSGRERESDLRAPASSMMDPGYVSAPLASDFLSSRQEFAEADPQILAGVGDPSIPASKFNVRARMEIIQDLSD
ncbi:hypothetical protein LCGC14_3151100, partial [marine sediment metagenome]